MKQKIELAENDTWKLLKIRLNKIKSHKVFEVSIITVIVVSAIAVGAHSYPLSPQTIKIQADEIVLFIKINNDSLKLSCEIEQPSEKGGKDYIYRKEITTTTIQGENYGFSSDFFTI
tara:strand:- start:950 stop:1300 length:351 start_codon:yes stop_codon:yes gene_type:complete